MCDHANVPVEISFCLKELTDEFEQAWGGADDTLLSRGDHADNEAADDEHEYSRKQNNGQKKKTEGVAEPQEAETAESKEIESEKSEAKTGGKRAAAKKRVPAKPKGGAKTVAAKRSSAGLKSAAPKTVGRPKAAPKAVDKTTQATVVRKLLKTVEAKLSREDMKASLGDYIRLVQLQKELDDEAPREIKVTWVDHPELETAGLEQVAEGAVKGTKQDAEKSSSEE